MTKKHATHGHFSIGSDECSLLIGVQIRAHQAIRLRCPHGHPLTIEGLTVQSPAYERGVDHMGSNSQ